MLLIGPVLRVLGYFCVALALLMLVPAAVDLYANNPDWLAFALTAIFIGMIGLLLSVATSGYQIERISTRQAFLITASAWFLLPAAGALPFLGLGIGFVDAFFESASGFTTTGSTVLIGLDSMPPGLLLWRSLTQWVGGVGIIVMAIMLMPRLRIGGMQLFRTESSDKSDKIFSRAGDQMRYIAGVYMVLTGICVFGYLLFGMDLFDAVNHAMTTLSSGGFSTHDASFAHFDGLGVRVVAIVFMMAAGLPFVLLVKSLTKSPLALFRDPQAQVFFKSLLVISICMTIYLGAAHQWAFGEALVDSLFVVTSIVTTTGYGLGDYTTWGAPMVGVVFMMTLMGGCTGSTAGGIKTFRFMVFFGTVRAHMRQMLRPDRVVVVRYGDTQITPDLAFSVLAFFVVYMGTVVGLTVVLGGLGLDLVTALSAAATALGNVGPGLGDQIGPVGSFAELPESAKAVLAVAMLLGRLELFTIILLFDPEFWR
ncbi:TrkH family potassium uptake protein [Polycladidibacter hongkongensis]|uniref:TrkH family potassium uptake protein n=1 Tax=Polycladidibacter hongkongensis TaxID=1647556 RepID=UPI000A9F91A0|nr:TrkH family potassium uptake protein [Pseudovibrio hongkongensis]